MEQKTAERIAGLEMQVKIFKWALGGFCILMMSLGGWVYAQGSKTSSLEKEISFESRLGSSRGAAIKENSRAAGEIKGDIKAIKKEFEGVNRSLDRIEKLLERNRQ